MWALGISLVKVGAGDSFIEVSWLTALDYVVQ